MLRGGGKAAGQSQILVHGEIAWISLSQSQWAIVDLDDVAIVAGRHWHVWKKPGKTHYAHSNARNVDGRRTTIQMHRVLLDSPFGTLTDHRDGNGLNNRRSNLRICSGAENSRNRKSRTTSKYGLKGVCWIERNRKFSASIKKCGRGKHLGYFDSAEEAHRAYVSAASEMFGDFARAT